MEARFGVEICLDHGCGRLAQFLKNGRTGRRMCSLLFPAAWISGPALLLQKREVSCLAAMDLGLEDQRIPETSDNFAMIDMGQDEKGSYILFTANIRSSLATKKAFLTNQFTTIAGIIGATYTIDGEYPAWEFNPDSYIRTIFIRAFQDVYEGRRPKVEGIHAGLECGILADHFKSNQMDVDLIAFGPDIFGAHTPQEQVKIPSVGRSWELLKRVLEIVHK